MKRLLQYFLLETKKILLQLPKLLLGSFLLLAVTFFCIFLIRANSAREEKSKPVFIGILAEKEEPFIDWIIKTANNMPDMGYSFHIERIEKKTAENHFFDEDSHVLFIVPKNYISSIIDGKNEHLTIRFSKSQTTIVNTLIKELADAASSYILDTEGAIYSMQDYYKKYHLPNESKDELFLNIKYVQEIIDFTDAIEAVPPDAKRESSVPVVCLSAGIVLAPLILGLILTPVLTSEGQLNKQLIRLRLYIRKQIFVKILVFILTIFIIFFFLA
ncbi:MAG: hypothetical protein IJ733_14025, partial [Lachnospiraceae bacterium]|nr:hypothetical protein [Lachnospiraceae bacterium]